MSRARGMGSVRRRRTGLWEGRFQGKSVYGKTKSEAEEKLDALLQERGVLSGLTVERFLAIWLELERPRLRPRSYERYESAIRVHVNPRIGQQHVTAVYPSDIERLTAQVIGSGISPRTASFIRSVLSSAFRWGVSDGLIERNPVTNARPPRLPRVKRDVLTKPQVTQLMDALKNDPYWHAFFALAIHTGMRDAELRGLSVGDIDLDARLIHVRSQVQYRAGRLISVPVKSDHSERTIRIGGALASVLARHIGSRDTGYLFTRPGSDEPMPQTMRQQKWDDLRQALNLTMNFHGLRRTCATLLIDAGVSVKTAQAILGHASPATTLAMYAQATDEGMEGAASVMEGILGTESG